MICLISLVSLTTLAGCAGSTTAKPTVASTAPESAAVASAANKQTTAEPVAKPVVKPSTALSTNTASIGKVMVLDFVLNDLTDLPNPPEELARIAYFNVAFKQKLVDDGVEMVPVNDKIKAISAAQSATYLFDHTDIAASLAEGSGADYILIGVAMKPTYLFVYPRLLLVDVKTKRKAFTSYVQMEGSWLETTTTASSAKSLAKKVSAELKKLAGQANWCAIRQYRRGL